MGSGGVSIPTERQVQRAILQMCGLLFPDVVIHHSPNGTFLGSARDKAIRGGASKGDGTKAGWPDLECFWQGGGCFLEVKRPKTGVLSDNQKAIHERLSAVGWPVTVVRSPDEAHAALCAAGAPCRGTL
jgi:hypothetical protein